MTNKILFVDDDMNILSSFRRRLGRRFDITTLLGGERGLEALDDEGPFAVVITDQRMPNMDGIAFLGEVRKRAPDTVRIMLTGNTDVTTAIKAVNEGSIFRFFTKPYPLDDLASAIEVGLEQYNLVTAERELRDVQLTMAKEQAELANRAKSEFLAAMSHELRTPLNAILGFSEIIKNETLGPAGSLKYREYAGDIHESGQHLLDLINDILDLSKTESGTDELHEDKIEIPETIRSTLKLVGHRAEQGGVRVELEFPDQLPALRADERKLKQILVNLLSNAVKFTDAGGVVTLKAWCRMDSGYVFQIADTGIGIAPEDIPKALSRFGQVDADLNRQYEGTGLGLPLTKALVEQHGGVLDLQSEVNVGTTVTVRFPAERIVASLDHADSLDVEHRAAS